MMLAPSDNQALRPLTAADQSMTMENLLDYCNFACNDMMPQGLINLAHIRLLRGKPFGAPGPAFPSPHCSATEERCNGFGVVP
ncbi:hypothetical protein VP01_1874g6 [Puccinia sorghi]|uniref:Uncharacterized protein n=1 Tax=Puccinia sorghi TaxID=27349 RepID=A0A0L6VDC0_9BASI|nr:hypothetical protein VP01_1874g6 [Puccinia sorghi]